MDSGKLSLDNINTNMITASGRSAVAKLLKQTADFYMGAVVSLISSGQIETVFLSMMCDFLLVPTTTRLFWLGSGVCAWSNRVTLPFGNRTLWICHSSGKMEKVMASQAARHV